MALRGVRERLASFGLLRDPRFARLWAAGVISQSGDWMLIVGLTYFVYTTTRSVPATGALFLAAVIPQVVMGSLAGVFVDRWDRRRTMVAANLILAAGLAPLLLAHGPTLLLVVYPVLGFEAVVDSFFGPAEGAFLPVVVGPDRLLAANALYGGGRQVSRLVGSALGGIAVGFFGLGGVLVPDALSFLLSAGLILSIRIPSSPTTAPLPGPPAVEPRSGLTRVGSEWREGVRQALAHPVALTLLVFAAVTGVGEGIFTTLMAPFVVGVLHGNGAAYGAFLGLQAAGGIVGALVATAWARSWSPYRLFPAAATVFAALDGVLFTYPVLAPSVGPALVLIVLIGLPATLCLTAYTTLQQTALPDRLRGRYLGLVGAVSALTLVVGIAVASALATVVGIIPMLEVQVAVYLLGGGLFFVRFRDGAPDVADRPERIEGTTQA